MNEINRPLFLDTRRRRAQQFAVLLALVASSAGVVAALFFGIGALISPS